MLLDFQNLPTDAMLVHKCRRVTCYICPHKHKVPSEEPSTMLSCECDVILTPTPTPAPLHPHPPTPHPHTHWVGWMQALTSISPCLPLTRALPSLWYRQNLDSLTCALRRSIVLQFFWHVDTRPISPFLFFFNSTFYLCIIIVIFLPDVFDTLTEVAGNRTSHFLC